METRLQKTLHSRPDQRIESPLVFLRQAAKNQIDADMLEGVVCPPLLPDPLEGAQKDQLSSPFLFRRRSNASLKPRCSYLVNKWRFIRSKCRRFMDECESELT